MVHRMARDNPTKWSKQTNVEQEEQADTTQEQNKCEWRRICPKWQPGSPIKWQWIWIWSQSRRCCATNNRNYRTDIKTIAWSNWRDSKMWKQRKATESVFFRPNCPSSLHWESSSLCVAQAPTTSPTRVLMSVTTLSPAQPRLLSLAKAHASWTSVIRPN